MLLTRRSAGAPTPMTAHTEARATPTATPDASSSVNTSGSAAPEAGEDGDSAGVAAGRRRRRVRARNEDTGSANTAGLSARDRARLKVAEFRKQMEEKARARLANAAPTTSTV